MIRNRLNQSQCPIDILRLIVNRSQIYSLIILVNGHSQSGKSTAIFYIANRIIQIRKGIDLKRATWREWDYKRFTTTTPQDFVRLWDENENEILAMEEASYQMNYLDFFGLMGRVFSSTTRTQGIKRQICFLITPHTIDLMKHNREAVDFRIWVKRRDDIHKRTQLRPRFIKIDYLRDKYKLGYIKDWTLQYNHRFLKEAQKYTDWLKGFKSDIVEHNKELVGIKPDYVLEAEKILDGDIDR